jgi:hypothetical protein
MTFEIPLASLLLLRVGVVDDCRAVTNFLGWANTLLSFTTKFPSPSAPPPSPDTLAFRNPLLSEVEYKDSTCSKAQTKVETISEPSNGSCTRIAHVVG